MAERERENPTALVPRDGERERAGDSERGRVRDSEGERVRDKSPTASRAGSKDAGDRAAAADARARVGARARGHLGSKAGNKSGRIGMTKDGGMKVMKHGAAKDAAAGRSVQEVRAILVAQVVNLEAAVRAVDAEGAGRLSLAALAEALLVLSDMEALELTRDEVERFVSAVGAGDGSFFESLSAGGMVDIATFLAHFRHSPPGLTSEEMRELKAWAGGAAATGHELGLDASSHARVPLHARARVASAEVGGGGGGGGGVGSTSIMLRGSSVLGHAVHVAEAGVFSVLNSSVGSKRRKAKADVDVLRVATRSNPNIDLLTTIAHAAWARKKDTGGRGGGGAVRQLRWAGVRLR